MPQLEFHTFPSQIFWLLVVFVALYFVMARLALPKIGTVLESRRRKIDDDLERASAQREEAAALLAAYEKALAKAHAEAKSIHAQAHQAMADMIARRQAEVGARIADEIRAAEQRIHAAKQPAMAELEEVSAELVQAVADRIAKVKVTMTDARAALKASGREG